MLEKESKDLFDLDVSNEGINQDKNGGITPLDKEKHKGLEESDSNLIDSKDSYHKALKDENLIANKSINEGNGNFEAIKAILFKISLIKRIKDNNILSSINVPHINFLSSNHTLKQIIPLIFRKNGDENLNAKKQYDIIKTIPYVTKLKQSENIVLNTSESNPKKNKKSPLIRLGIFFSFCLLLLIIGYKIITNGIFIENLKIANITIHSAFLQLKNKLVLEIDLLEIQDNAKQSKKEHKSLLDGINNTIGDIQKTLYVLSYFEKFEIKKLRINDQQWDIYYTNTNYIVNGPIFSANFDINNNQNNLYIKINKFILEGIEIHIVGDFIYSIPQKQFLFDISLIKNTNEKEKIMLKGSTDFHTIVMNGKSTDISDLLIIKPFIDNIENIKLKTTLQNWIFNNIKYSSFNISTLKMNISLNDISNTLLHNTLVEINIKDPEVLLAKKLQPIIGKNVLLEFQNTNLTIKPIQASFSKMDLSGSQVLIANMPHSDIIIDLNAKNVRLDSNLKQLIEHYGVTIPVSQHSLHNKAYKRAVKKDGKSKLEISDMLVQNEINKTENLVTQALKTPQKLQVSLEQSNVSETSNNMLTELQKEENTIELNNKFYNQILELNPNTTLTNELLYNPNYDNNEITSMHIKISILHNKKTPKIPLFYLQGIIQAQNTKLNIYDVPLRARKLNVALDITPNQKIIYINGDNIKWNSLVDANINALLDIGNKTLHANTYIHKAILNTSNLKDLNFTQEHKDSNIVNKSNKKTKTTQNMLYNDLVNISDRGNIGIYLGDDFIFQNKQDFKKYCYDCKIIQTRMTTSNDSTLDSNKLLENSKKQNNMIISKDVTDELPKDNIVDNGDKAGQDINVLKTLKNNPVWDDLKIRTKKTQTFVALTNKELENLALKEIEKEKEGFHLKQDFINIKKSNINLTLSFANDKLILDIPALSVHLESSENLHLEISKIENILQFSPLANYYGITHGNLKLHATRLGGMDFLLNITNLDHPLYTINHKKVSEISLNGKLHKDTLVIVVNDNIDFKSQDSLSMLRIKGYRIDVDEAYKSKIPFFVDLFKDKQIDDLPYSEAAINQEIKLIEIKNKLRKKLNIKPTDFNIIGENLQLTFLGYTIPFDYANIRFIDNKIIVDGQYEKGILNASLIKDNISVNAKNFSSEFLNIVLTSTKDGKRMFEGGTFSLDGLYRGGILNAALEIQKTSLIDFKSVQNIFALIDTVPSLFMFKDPHISTTGYQVNYGKILFAINDDYIGLQNIFLLGSSMDINGQGIIDIDSKEANINLNISTIKNLSKFINKIPIIGYLILGREGQISTNLILTGKYDDPKVNITLAKDIIKAPFNILRRVFPIEMIINNNDNEEDIDY